MRFVRLNLEWVQNQSQFSCNSKAHRSPVLAFQTYGMALTATQDKFFIAKYLSIWNPASDTSSSLTRIWCTSQTCWVWNRQTGSTCASQLPGALAAYLSLQQYCTAENIHDYLKRSCTLTCLFIYINIFSDYQPDKTVITEFSILKRPQWCQGSAGELNILSSIIPTSFFMIFLSLGWLRFLGQHFLDEKTKTSSPLMPSPVPLGDQRGTLYMGM